MVASGLWPTYAHFELPWVRGIWRNIQGEIQAAPLPPEGKKALGLLPLLVFEANHPLPHFPVRLSKEGKEVLEFVFRRFLHYPELPLEERLWYALVLPYRFASPKSLGIPIREIALAPIRRLIRSAHSPYRHTMLLVDRLTILGAPKLAADGEVVLHMEILKSFHKGERAFQIQAPISPKEVP